MKTLTLKLPEPLEAKLTELAKQRGETKSSVVRAAIEDYLASSGATRAGSCLDLARDLVACFDGPGDLSHNQEHMRGYGE